MTVDLDVLVRSDLLDFLTQGPSSRVRNEADMLISTSPYYFFGTESKDRGATILYATHIFDGLDDFPTHIAHMRDGSFVIPPVPWPFSGGNAGTGSSSSSGLYTIALAWLKEDREVRRAAEKDGMALKTRGSRVSISTYHFGCFTLCSCGRGLTPGDQAQPLPRDGETFYKK